jgi:hypothetical protein
MVIVLYKWLLVVNGLFGGIMAADAAAMPHPLYVTVTEINHNGTDKTLEISCKIFTDDFEKTLNNAYHKTVDFNQASDTGETARLVFAYIKSHLALKLDGKPVQLEYVGFEKENDAVWSFFQVSNTKAPAKIEITNSLLYDAYDKEMNLMHVSVGGKRKSTRLNFPDKEVKLEF